MVPLIDPPPYSPLASGEDAAAQNESEANVNHELALREDGAVPSNEQNQVVVVVPPQNTDKNRWKGPSGVSMVVHVVAPASLPEGYVFDASIGDGRTIKVTVPPGGIEEGQTFEVPMPREVQSMVTGEISIPVGHWRDGLFNCFGYGVCHPHCWTGCFCHLRKLLLLICCAECATSLFSSHNNL